MIGNSVTEHLHPLRYPKHPDTNKGQIFGGICNRTACDNGRAVWYNLGTRGLYCTPCARRINEGSEHDPVLIVVEQKPTVAEMNQLERNRVKG